MKHDALQLPLPKFNYEEKGENNMSSGINWLVKIEVGLGRENSTGKMRQAYFRMGYEWVTMNGGIPTETDMTKGLFYGFRENVSERAIQFIKVINPTVFANVSLDRWPTKAQKSEQACSILREIIEGSHTGTQPLSSEKRVEVIHDLLANPFMERPGDVWYAAAWKCLDSCTGVDFMVQELLDDVAFRTLWQNVITHLAVRYDVI